MKLRCYFAGSLAAVGLIGLVGVAGSAEFHVALVGILRDLDGREIHFSKHGLKLHGEAWAKKVGPAITPSICHEEP